MHAGLEKQDRYGGIDLSRQRQKESRLSPERRQHGDLSRKHLAGGFQDGLCIASGCPKRIDLLLGDTHVRYPCCLIRLNAVI
ncbi:ABC-type phosphate transport system, ATPase component [Acetobacter aceti NRIC 0242]|nr:ABC-type phosphate transport system, ATPase component [Acetobacter aceti NRIC 0242]